MSCKNIDPKYLERKKRKRKYQIENSDIKKATIFEIGINSTKKINLRFKQRKEDMNILQIPIKEKAAIMRKKVELQKEMGRFKPKTQQEINLEMDKRVKNGEFQTPPNSSEYADIHATDIYDKPHVWPYTHDEWMQYSHTVLKLIPKLLQGAITPRWDLVKFRSEKEFKAGIYSAFAPIWKMVINELNDEQTQQIAYKIIHSGVCVFDNQQYVSPWNAVEYRNSNFLCTQKTTNFQNLKKHSMMASRDKHKASYTEGGMKYKINQYYPVEVEYLTKRKFRIKPFYQENSKKTLLCPEEITTQLKEWIVTGAIEYVGPAQEVESPIRAGMVMAINIKPDKIKLRLCFDGSAWSQTQRFNIPCVLDCIGTVLPYLKMNDYFTKWDDKSGFHQLKMDEMSKHFTHFNWGDHIFRYKAACFGLGLVPANFQLANYCAVNWLRKMGIKIFLYLDDRLIVENKISRDVMAKILEGKLAPRNAVIAMILLTAMGTFISKSKSTPICTQELEFLGIVINSKNQTIEISEFKWNKLQDLIEKILSKGVVFYKDLEICRGYMCSLIIVIKNMQLYIRISTQLLEESNKNDNPWITVTDELRTELSVWKDEEIKYINRKRKWFEPSNVVIEQEIYTDASGYAMGWYTAKDDESFSLYWNKADAVVQIAVKEALAILYYVEHHTAKLENKRTVFMCDNQAVCEAFEMGSRDATLNRVITNINMKAVQLNVHLRIQWVSTKLQLADEPSRILDMNEETLKTEVLESLIKRYKLRPNLDGMATFYNKKCARYISRTPETFAEHTDFFSYKPEKTDILYIFPPKNAINFTVPKILKDYKKNNFILIYHEFAEVPPFLPYLPGTAHLVRLQDHWNNPTLIPSKKRNPEYGYMTPNLKVRSTFAVIHNIA